MTVTINGSGSITEEITIDGVKVGQGGGNVSTNTAVGASALAANTTGSENSAVGYQALDANTTGLTNTAVGAGALGANTTANDNTAVGRLAAALNTTGASNSALGSGALYSNTTGSNNTAIGYNTLVSNTTASNNTAVGYQAMYSYQTGGDNVAVGTQAGYSINGNGNSTFVGRSAGYSTTGGNNTFVGYRSGYDVTTGTKNTILGLYNGNQGGLDIRTSSNYIVLSDGDGNPRGYSTGASWVFNSSVGPSSIQLNSGVYFHPNPDNTISCGFSSLKWTVVYATTGTINTSDVNEKQDIQDLSAAELAVAQEIKTLIKTFRWKDAVAKKGDAARIHVGVIAQDVKAAFERQGLDASRYALFCSDTWYEVDGKPITADGTMYTAESEGAVEKTRLGVRYDQLLAFVIAAL